MEDQGGLTVRWWKCDGQHRSDRYSHLVWKAGAIIVAEAVASCCWRLLVGGCWLEVGLAPLEATAEAQHVEAPTVTGTRQPHATVACAPGRHDHFQPCRDPSALRLCLQPSSIHQPLGRSNPPTHQPTNPPIHSAHNGCNRADSTMSASLPGNRELPASRYDLSTYWGRVKHSAEISDPR